MACDGNPIHRSTTGTRPCGAWRAFSLPGRILATCLTILVVLSPAFLPRAAARQVDAPAPPATQRTDEAIEPLYPVGVSEQDIELYATYAYSWRDAEGWRINECLGDFELRLGGYSMRSRDAVVWFRRQMWRDRAFYDVEVFLWREAQIRHPAGTIETGDGLFARVRSFGKLVLNADGFTPSPDEHSELFAAARAVRAGGIGPAAAPDETTGPVQATRPAGFEFERPPRPRIPVSYGSEKLTSIVRDGRRLVIAIGDVYVTQGAATSADFLELRADAAVLYMREGVLDVESPDEEQKPKERPDGEEPPPDEALPRSPAEERLEEKKTDRDMAREYVEAVYLEGDVVLTRGQRMIRASRLYYDFANDRALILDAVMRGVSAQRNLPVYVRADQIRQLSETEFRADDATISTSEFHTPHIALGAEEVRLIDRTPRNERGEVIGIEAGAFVAKHTTLQLDGAPVFYWPYNRGDFAAEQQTFRSAKFGYTSEFGGTIETRWRLFDVLGLAPPPGYDGTLRLDYFTQRGPGVGIDLDYQRDDSYGLLRTYYVNDSDEDDLGGNPQRGGPPDTEDRGRVLWRHRQFLDQGWELTLETAYLSDDQFLEQYERNEFENAKDQETVLYLLKRRRNWQFSTLFNANINDFLTQTEHYPDVRFSLLGEPVGDYLTWYHDSRGGVVRYDLDDNARELFLPKREQNSRAVWRGDLREEAQFPLPALGPVKVTPFATLRGNAWDGAPGPGGGYTRAYGATGLRSNMYFQRTFDDVESRLLDLHRLRHIIKPEGTLWIAGSNRDSVEQWPFDADVEGYDDFSGGVLALRQRWQTKRGAPGRWRTVDWIILDLEAGFFSNSRPTDNTHGNFVPHRPEDSISSNYLSVDFLYRLSDSTALIYDGVYDWNRGNAGVSNVSLAYERLPRLATFVGWRYIHDTDSNLVGFGSNYKLNEKHTVGFRDYFDIEEGRNLETQLILIRRWPRWYTGVSVEWDRSVDDFSISLTIWPEGAPTFAIGSKRYTQLGETVGIRP